MMVTIGLNRPEVSPLSASNTTRNDFYWRSLPGHVSPSVIYNNNGWANSSGGGHCRNRNHLCPPSTRDADADSSGSGSGDEVQSHKGSLVSRQLARIRTSMRTRRSTGGGNEVKLNPPDNDSENTPLMSSNQTACDKFHKKRDRSASTPTLCCCSSGPNRRCSQPIHAPHASVRDHFHALARVFKRNFKKSKSISTAQPDTADDDKQQMATHLRSLANGCSELKPRLITVLRNQRAHEAFRQFLKGEYSDENIDFWSAVERYKSLSDHDEKRPDLAREIVSTYLETDAPFEINISYETKAETLKAVETLTSSTFTRAQNEILFLMESDAFKRFIAFE